MTALLLRTAACTTPDTSAAELADVIVFASTTCLCALGALMLPLVG